MSDEKIKKALQDAGIGEMITCPQAFSIAEKAKVSRKCCGRVLHEEPDQDPELPAGLLQMSRFLNVISVAEAVVAAEKIAPTRKNGNRAG